MRIECAHTKLLEINRIVPHPRNRNKHSEKQIKALAKVIKKNGQRSPIVISKRSGYVSKGHGRLEAIKLLGWDKCAVDMQDYESEEAELRDRIADNEIARYAEFDNVGFVQDLKDLSFDIEDINFEDFGLLDFSLPGDPITSDEKDDEIPATENNEHNVKLGDIWELGEHRLMCGDSTDKECIDRLMDGEKADMVFTDPPFGIDLNTDYSDMGEKSQKHKKIIGDDKAFNAFFIIDIFSYCKELFLFGANYYIETIERTHDNLGSWLVWDKYPTDQNDKRFGSAFELIWSKTKHKQSILRINSLNVGIFKPEAIIHPSQKPTTLAMWFLDKYTKEKDLVVDLFLGSGSTLIACEKTKRKCYGMELDEHYCSVIIKRWEEHTGKKAISAGMTYAIINNNEIINDVDESCIINKWVEFKS